MDTSAELGSLLLSLYRGARELPRVAFEEFALARIKPLLDFESAVWAQGRTDGRSVAVRWAHAHDIDPEAPAAWQAINAQDKLIPLTVANAGRTVHSHTPTLFSAPQDNVCRDYALRFGTQQVLIMTVPDGEPQAVRWMALYRADADDHYSARDRALCDAVLPHLMEALSVNRLATRAAPDASPPSERPRLPLALADPAGRLRFAQDAFLHLAREEWPGWDGGRLPADILVAIAGRQEACHVGRATRCRILRRADMLLLEIRRRSPLDRLPPQRARIALLYAQGYSHKEVARTLGLAPSTVRNQLASAYRDLQIGTRSQLIAIADLTRRAESMPLPSH